MSPPTLDRLEAAQNRLRAALLAGQSTAPHRDAVALVEAAVAAEKQRQQDAAASTEQARAERIASRTAELNKECRDRIVGGIPPIPAFQEPNNE